MFWLRDIINNLDQSAYKVAIDCKIEKDPLRWAKKTKITSATEVWHISDYESNDEFHVQQFKNTIDKLKEAEKIGKEIKYKFGYSNYTFDLWIILHMDNCYGPKTDRKQYLQPINRAFNKQFLTMSDYKHENNFKSCLAQLNINHVIKAIERSKVIMKLNEDNGNKIENYKGYKYYKVNPSLMIWEIIEKILKDCSLI